MPLLRVRASRGALLPLFRLCLHSAFDVLGLYAWRHVCVSSVTGHPRISLDMLRSSDSNPAPCDVSSLDEFSDATSPRSSERSRRKPTGLTKSGRTWVRMNDWRCRSSFSSCALDGCSLPPSDGRQHVKQYGFTTRHPSFEALLGLARPSLTSPATRLSTGHEEVQYGTAPPHLDRAISHQIDATMHTIS